MINNAKELIEKTKELENEYDKIMYILEYLIKTVKFDYSYLFINNYLKGSITEFSKQKVDFNKYQKSIEKINGKNSNISFVRIRKIEKGSSILFDNIIKLKAQNKDYDSFITKLKSLLTLEFKNIINNEEIINEEIELLMNKIESELKEGAQINFAKESYFIKNDISQVLADFILDSKFHFKPIYNEDLLIKGKSEDYVEFLKYIFSMLNIQTHIIKGINEYEYNWLCIKINNKYKIIDLTTSIFIRDGKIKNKNEKLFSMFDLSELFKLEPEVTITSIDNNELTINKKNFDEKEFITKLK